MRRSAKLVLLGVLAIVCGVAVFAYWLVRSDFGEYTPPGKLERKIAKQVDRCPPSDCRIQMSQVTNFEWDQMYVFGEGVSRQDLEAALHLPFPQFQEIQPKLIFVKNRKIVYFENRANHIEKAAKNGVSFDDVVGSTWKAYGHEAEFRASREEIEDGYAYRLVLMK